jgi:hypothetical protein
MASDNGAVELKNWPFPSRFLPLRCGSASSEERQGTRYYLNSSFFILYILQIVNATIQHYSTPHYIIYISIIYGPILFLSVLLSQWAQDFAARFIFQVDEIAHNAVLWPCGGLTMHRTTTISQDIKVALVVPFTHFLQALVWLAISYGVMFGKTRYYSLQILVVNVSYQALLINATISWVNLLVSAFPTSASSLWAGAFMKGGLDLKQTALAVDSCGLATTLLLLVLGLHEIFFEYDNGTGLFNLFCAAPLTIMCVQRLRNREEITNHDVMGRICYQEQEEVTEDYIEY